MMQLQLTDDQIAYLLAAAGAKPEDTVLESLAAVLNERIASNTDETDQKYREAADNEYGRDGECEIDDGAPVSRGDDPGAYVQAWVWVSNAEAGIASDGEAEDADADEEEDDEEDDD
jgi:ribosomal protein L12E/L44/L45/RPP1/RPP2